MLYESIIKSGKQAVSQLITKANLMPGSLVVIGCSTSEMLGETIGSHSAYDAAQALFDAVNPVFSDAGIHFAAQCCEHLNRALVLEREVAISRGYEPVWVIPKPKAGGSFATACWRNFKDPVVVEQIRADAGLDIGGTLIGMHLKAVAVPLRLEISSVGKAPLICAYTRPRLIGGERAVYTEDNKPL